MSDKADNSVSRIHYGKMAKVSLIYHGKGIGKHSVSINTNRVPSHYFPNKVV